MFVLSRLTYETFYILHHNVVFKVLSVTDTDKLTRSDKPTKEWNGLTSLIGPTSLKLYKGDI